MILLPEVLRRVSALLDQDTRVHVCASSGALYDALAHPDAWGTITVHDSTYDAGAYLVRARPHALDIAGGTPRAAAMMLDCLAAAGVSLRAVGLRFSEMQGLVDDLMRSLGNMSDLERLSLSFHTAFAGEQGVRLDLPGLPALRSLRVHDASYPANADLNFVGNRFPALHAVDIVVRSADLMSCIGVMPALRDVRYSALREDYRHVCMGDARLSALRLDVRSTGAARRLMHGLAEAGAVDRLRLCVYADDVQLPARVGALRDVSVLLHAPALTLTARSEFLRGLRGLSVRHPWNDDGWPPEHWTLVVEDMHFRDFAEWSARSGFSVGKSCCLHVKPCVLASPCPCPVAASPPAPPP
jgi:hypothetical protein